MVPIRSQVVIVFQLYPQLHMIHLNTRVPVNRECCLPSRIAKVATNQFPLASLPKEFRILPWNNLGKVPDDMCGRKMAGTKLPTSPQSDPTPTHRDPTPTLLLNISFNVPGSWASDGTSWEEKIPDPTPTPTPTSVTAL